LLIAPLVTSLLSSLPRFRNEAELLLLALPGAACYGILVLVLFGRRWTLLLRRSRRGKEAPPPVDPV
jgi:hypothetical protein